MPERPATYRDLIQHEASTAGIPPELAFAIVDQESGGKAGAIGQPTKGGQAQGFFQLMPETAAQYGVDPTDPQQNIRGGIALLKDLNAQYKGDVRQILSAYHGGSDPANYGPKTQAYVQTIMGRLLAGQPGTPLPPVQRGARQAKPTPAGVTHRVTGAAPAVGVPPPTPLPQFGSKESLVAQPPPSPVSLERGLEEPELTPEQIKAGRQNIGALAGLGVATAVSGGAALPVILAATSAGAGAGLTSAVQGGTPAENVGAAGWQAAMELTGHGIGWGLGSFGRRAMAHPVAKQAKAKLTAVRQSAMTALDDALDTARSAARAVGRTAKQQVQTAKTTATQGVAGARQTAAQGIEQAAAPYEAMLAAPPPRQAAGEAVAAVVQGPAKSMKNRLGEQVETAAASGPAVATAPLRERVDELAAQITPNVQPAESRLVIPGYSAEQIAAIEARNPGVSTRLVGAGAAIAPDHPLRGTIGQLQRELADAGPDIPFSEAHKMKRMLDEAVNWDRAAKSQVEQITKGFRQTLRDEMAGHAPYEQATAAYKSAADLFRSDHARQILKAARTEPSAFISRISPDRPQSAAMLKELLVDFPAQSGDQAAAAQGQRAWDSVRAVWTHQRVVKGGIEGLGKRLDGLAGTEFADTLYGDASGQQILRNLRQISDAYTDAVAQKRIIVEGARQAGATGTTATRQIGETAREAEAVRLQGLRRQRKAAAAQTPAEKAFEESTIKPDVSGDEFHRHFADLIRIGVFGPGSYLGAYSIGRILKGPKAADLVTWAAYGGTKRTQLLVNLFTSQAPGAVAADLIRMWDADHAKGADGEEEAGGMSPALRRAIEVGSAPPSPPMQPLLGAPPP